MVYIYLLESENNKHLYLGSTIDVNLRLEEHNHGLNSSTKNKGPWKILNIWEIGLLREARQIEYKIKRMKHKLSKEYIDYFINNYKQSQD